MWRFCWFLLGVVCLRGLAVGEVGLHGQAPRVLMVFDASQSMYGKIGGGQVSKLELAKTTVGKALEDWAGEMEVGLLAYGHRGRRVPGGRCADVELIAPVGTASEVVAARVKALQARGTTPLCAALELAGDHLKGSGASLLLVSDGAEECGGDLEETTRRLIAEHPGLTAHVLSLEQGDDVNAILRALATMSSGSFFDIREADQGEPALEAITQRVLKETNLIVHPYHSFKENARSTEPMTWSLYGGQADADGDHALVGRWLSPSLRLQVTPGLYWVSADDGREVRGWEIHVPQGKVVERTVGIAPGVVTLIPQGLDAERVWTFRVEFAMPGGDEKMLVEKAKVTGKHELSLPHGHYRLHYGVVNEGAAVAFKTITFEAEAERRRAFDVRFP